MEQMRCGSEPCSRLSIAQVRSRAGLPVKRDRGAPTRGSIAAQRHRHIANTHLHIDITVDDPKGYTRPWTVTVDLKVELDTEMLDSTCLENEQDVPHLKAADAVETAR